MQFCDVAWLVMIYKRLQVGEESRKKLRILPYSGNMLEVRTYLCKYGNFTQSFLKIFASLAHCFHKNPLYELHQNFFLGNKMAKILPPKKNRPEKINEGDNFRSE